MSVVGNPKVSFTVQSSLEMAHRVSQLLALAELQGSGWLHAVISEVHLLRKDALRVVMRIDPKDLGRALSVENWAKLHTANLQAEALEVSEVPEWVLVDTVSGLPRSNLACAKTLVEILLLLLNKIDFPCSGAEDCRAQELCFWKIMHNIKCQSPTPASINDAQVESLMEMAEAWREYLGALWTQPTEPTPPPPRFLPALPPPLPSARPEEHFEWLGEPFTLGGTRYQSAVSNGIIVDLFAPQQPQQPQPPPQPRFDPDDFPALGSSPHGSPIHVAGRTRYSEGVAIVSVAQLLGKNVIHAPFVAKINVEDAKNLWAVAWMAGRPRENIWLSGTSANDIRHPISALSI